MLGERNVGRAAAGAGPGRADRHRRSRPGPRAPRLRCLRGLLRAPTAACWIEEANVTESDRPAAQELPAGDQLADWLAMISVFARRDGPHPGAQFDTVRGRGRLAVPPVNYSTGCGHHEGVARWGTPDIDAARRVRARVEDAIRTGKDAGLGHKPYHHNAVNAALG